MRYPILIALLGVSLLAQSQPNCSDPIARDADARCGCVKDPNSDLCKMVKRGFYEPGGMTKGMGGTIGQPQPDVTQPGAIRPGIRPAAPTPPPARPQQARVVPLAHTDYLRFLPPNARMVAGFDLGKALQSPELLEGVFGKVEDEDARKKVAAALKEMDRLWISFAAPTDLVILATGKFEQGAAAGMFYAQGVQPVFLGGAHAMMIGSEPSVQAALTRLSAPAVNAKPAANSNANSNNDGWVTRRARELSRDHEAWVVNDLSGIKSGAPLAIRQFALGFRITGEGSVEGEAVADSEAGVLEIAAWIDRMKAAMRDKTGVGALDSLTFKADGSTLRFAATGDALLAGEAGKTAMNSDFGVELYALTMASFPGMPDRTVAADKLPAVRAGMKKEEVLGLLGKPLSVSAIQGLDPPRETWSYQVAFGKRVTLKLDGGVVSSPPR